MADTKITALAAITTVDPAADVLPIVDISDTSMAASGTTKKITSNQILGAGGTATLASATITGDLTVDTNTLKVDSTNNRVGIGTASPTVTLDVVGAARFVAAASGPKLSIENAGGSTRFKSTDTSSFYYSAYDHYFTNTDGSVNRYSIDNNGVSIWYVSGSEAMRLNSTGLGVGASPTNKLTIGTGSYAAGTLSGTSSLYSTVAQGLVVLADGFNISTRTGGDRFTLDTSGNVGIGGNASATGIDTGVARLFVVAPNSNTGMAATFIADSVGRGLLVADQGKTNSFGVEVVAGLVKTGGFTSGTSVALFANAVERARVKSTGQVRFVPLAADPSGAEAGDVYYNSSSNKLKCYNGSTWNDLF